MNTKTCSTCKQTLPIESFTLTGKNSYQHQHAGAQPRREGMCKPCKAAYAREWRKTAGTNYRGSGKLKSIPPEDRLLASAISERLTQARERIKKYSQIETDLDRDYLYKLYKDQDGKCALSGVTLKVEKHAVTCLSLDKIKPELGYIKGNVQWVAWAVNRAKGDMSEAVFIDMCKRVFEYQKVQRLSKGSEN